MVQEVKALVAKPNDLNSIPGTHIMTGRTNSTSYPLTFITHSLWHMCSYTLNK